MCSTVTTVNSTVSCVPKLLRVGLKSYHHKRDPCALVVGLQIGEVLRKKSMKIPQKIKNTITTWPCNSTSGSLSLKNENTNSKRSCTLMFTAALFTIAKIWKYPGCPSITRMAKIDVTHTYNRILLSNKKEWNLAIYNNMEGHLGYY